MFNINSVISKTQTAFNQRRFNRELRNLEKTLPITLGKDPFTVLSMVHHRDVKPYLLALKSFCRFFSPQRIIVVADPSITDADRAEISRHVYGIEFVRAEDYRIPGMPQGGCWERLIAISEFVQDDYVVQLDADTVALAEMPEVRQAIERGNSFVLATEDGQDFVTSEDAATWAKLRCSSGQHVQIFAEANLDRLPDYGANRYVRGCAGFSGFAAGSFSRERLKAFSDTMAQALGNQWSAWGTEQFTSNFMVSNSPSATVLPHPKYCHPGREKAGTVFLHFIGYVRFTTGRYARAARETCIALT